MTKWMWIVAGPNGAGKTSIATELLADIAVPNLKKLNADERTLELRKRFPAESQAALNLLAAQQIDAEVLATIRADESFYVETVLSSPKYRQAVLEAKERGYKIGLIYISLYPPELSPARVKLRVAKGGHDVDAAKATDRYYRSHQQFRWFAKQADSFIALDNSGTAPNPIVIAAKMLGKTLVHRNKDVNPSVDRVICALKKKKYQPSIAKVG